MIFFHMLPLDDEFSSINIRSSSSMSSGSLALALASALSSSKVLMFVGCSPWESTSTLLLL